MHGRRILAALVAALTLIAALTALTACESADAKKQKAWQISMKSDLGALADKGDTGSMQLVADIELLRASGFLSDSAATALTQLPGETYFTYVPGGEPQRQNQAVRISTLLEFTTEEQALLKDGVITEAEAAEARRLAADNLAAAAELVSQYRGRRTAAK